MLELITNRTLGCGRGANIEGFMALHQYEEKFLDQLIDNWNGIDWDKYVKSCYDEYMNSVAEQELDMGLNML